MSKSSRVRAFAMSMIALVLLGLSAEPAHAAADDIVLYATDATNLNGHWSRAADSSAAGGQVITSTDTGWASATSVSAAPGHYFELAFDAPANTAYHVWLRLRAAANSKYNDSLYAQFSDSLDTNGSAIYRIGTTSGLNVNLQSCSGCALAGWGWMDRAYWLSQATTIKFSTSGTHTLRIQTREDGAALDQVVLSPSAYLTSAPGQALNDTTIVPKSASTSIPTTASASPYTGSPAAIPGTIQAENFDNGGEGVGYHDSTAGNSGGAYRQTDVDIEARSGGGYNVGWIAAGEWLGYTVNVASAGAYTVQFQVASSGQGGAFHLEMNGANVTGALTIPNTGGWQVWQAVSKTVTLNGGQQTARLVMDSNGSAAVGNVDAFTFTAATTSTSSGAPAVPDTPNPPNAAIGVTTSPNLSWKAAGATSYEIRVDTTNPPASVVSNTSDFWYSTTLVEGTKYYWQIVAKNSSGSTSGPVWSFTTTGATITPPATSAAGELIVAEWNVRVDDSSSAHARTVIDYLAALSPQPRVLVLTEARGSQYNTYLNELQNRTSYGWQGVFLPECPSGAWSGSSCTTSEDEGTAIFTSLPVVGSSSTYLPYADAYHSARALVRLAVSLNGTTVQVFGTHLQVGNATARNSSMAYLKNWAGNFSAPQIVGGDFNADPDQIDTTTGMLPNFVDSWFVVNATRGLTASTPSPTMKLDYLFADSSTKATPNWSSVVTGTGTVSDHFPLHTSFSVRP